MRSSRAFRGKTEPTSTSARAWRRTSRGVSSTSYVSRDSACARESPLSARKQILVADDEPNLRRILSAQLTRDGYDVETADNGAEAISRLDDHHIDVLVTDLRMPKVDGLGVLKYAVEKHPGMPVILITAHGTVDTAVEALKMGAFDYVTKPFDKDELRTVIAKAARTRDAREKDVAPLAPGRFRLIGQSAAMDEVYQVIDRVADTPSTVLITGESGTGKELIARALHENSGRKDRPFISVNCGAIPTELLESELFGYEKGAFTGAVTSKPGRFELADGGTLFLDEVGEIPITMQVKLLRAIQEQTFERVGGIRTIQVDVRLVAATNRDLHVALEQGTFRDDLYYRLNVVNLRLPPLRERV
ncbi:MAG: sigma-54-dependent Fis family transcriptional regulator, partial [Myxococcales bacterium]|nr:sigma-54-dependent Fis family transcriptional regulator [Myxococcales bacterium]